MVLRLQELQEVVLLCHSEKIQSAVNSDPDWRNFPNDKMDHHQHHHNVVPSILIG